MSTEPRTVIGDVILNNVGTSQEYGVFNIGSTLENGAVCAADGYPKLAQLMHRSPEAAIFRSFTELSLINLLRMQSELHWLEQRLEIARRSDTNHEDRKHSSRSFHQMGDNGSKQKELLEAIDLKLERYEKALLRMAKLRKVQKPLKGDFDALRFWLTVPDGGQNFLMAPEHTIWDPIHSDRMSLSEIEQRDIFSEAMYGGILGLHHKVWGQQKKKGPSTFIRKYDDDKINRLSDVLSTVVSSLLATLAILVLYFVKPLLIRIVLVVVFTGVFSLLLSIFTEARRIEIFSATAAFAAVVVVFVSNGAPDNGPHS